jgi:hypothetical protein
MAVTEQKNKRRGAEVSGFTSNNRAFERSTLHSGVVERLAEFRLMVGYV